MQREVHGQEDLLLVLKKQLHVDFENRLEQAHVCALVQADLVLPDVDEQDFAGGQCKKRALALKVLVFAALATVGALDVHDQDVVGHGGRAPVGLCAGALVLGHPYSLGCLAAGRLGHDAELGLEQVVEQGRLAGGLRPEDGDQVVVEAGLGDVRLGEVVIEIGAAERVVVLASCLVLPCGQRGMDGEWRHQLECFVLVDDLDAVLVLLSSRLVADCRKVAVHRGTVR
jgi:hypothetical protein